MVLDFKPFDTPIYGHTKSEHNKIFMSRREGKEKGSKKSKEDKVAEANSIKEYLMKYERIYILEFSSSKSEHLTEIRRRFKSSYLCLSKKKIMGFALGTTAENSTRPNIYLLNQYLTGNTAMFMTNESHQDVVSFMESLTCPEYATTGFIATETFVVPAGPLPQFQFDMDSHLRELGLPVQLDNGTINNIRDYEVCHIGNPITKHAATLLKHFERKIATFTVKPIALWEDGKVTIPNN